MFESINRVVLAGLGALSMSRERAEKIFDEYVRRGQAEKADRSGFVKDLMDSAEKARKDLEDLVAKQVRQALAALNVATREDIERLEAKVDELLKQTSP
jgi:polyhydroxyalkanoate synthesis regulator phasin